MGRRGRKPDDDRWKSLTTIHAVDRPSSDIVQRLTARKCRFCVDRETPASPNPCTISDPISSLYARASSFRRERVKRIFPFYLYFMYRYIQPAPFFRLCIFHFSDRLFRKGVGRTVRPGRFQAATRYARVNSRRFNP